jgi:predicted nucleotidyltransferase
MVQFVMKKVLNEKLKSLDNIEFAYLFGSYAREQEREKSDVDIAVFFKQNTLDVRLELCYELSRLIKKEVDLVVLNDVKNLFLLEAVFKEGKLLKDSPLRVDFELSKEHDILDYKELKRVINAA